MKNLNACLASLNLGLPDDVRRLKEAGYYTEAIACIDTYLAEDWTKTQNQPVQPAGPLPENPTPRGVDAMRDALLAQREILRRLPLDYTVSEAQALELLQDLVRDFTPEEFRALDKAGAMDWRFVEELSGCVFGIIKGILETSIGMSDEAFAAALAAAKQQGRSTVHVRVWLPLPAACPAQSNITLDSFTEPPTHIAPEDAAQRTAYWEADLAENRPFGAVYSYRTTARYADPLHMQADPVQPDFDTQEELPHLEFTPYLRALAAQLTQGITDPVQKAKRIYDYVTLNTHYHYQPPYFVQENITDGCVHNRRGDCGIMASTFIVLCRLVVRREMVGCHDWAAFYIAPHGWMYADCSAGASMARAGNEKMRLHYFGNLDTGRMVANRALCAPFDPPMCSFRADPCDNQVGEVEADGVGLYGEQLQWSQTLRRYETL